MTKRSKNKGGFTVRTAISSAVLSVILSGCGYGTDDYPELFAEDGTVAAQQNSDINIDLTEYTSGPKDADLTFSVTAMPKHGFLSLHGSSVEYYPDTDFIGEDRFEYSVIDLVGNKASHTITIDVREKSQAPSKPLQVILPEQLETQPGTSLLIEPIVLNNDGVLTHKLITASSFGSVVFDNNKITYIPLANFIGRDQFEIESVNEFGQRIVNTVHVVVGTGEEEVVINTIEEAIVPAHRQLYSLTAFDVDDPLKINWRQESGPSASIFQDHTGRALIQTAPSYDEIEVGLYIDEELIDVYAIAPQEPKSADHPFRLSLFPFDPLFVEANETHAFVFLDGIGIVSVNIENSNDPYIVAVYHSHQSPQLMMQRENQLIIMGYGFVEIVDITNVEKPVLNKSINISNLDPVKAEPWQDDLLIQTRSKGTVLVNLADSTVRKVSAEPEDRAQLELLPDNTSLLALHDAVIAISRSSEDLIEPLGFDTKGLEDAKVDNDKLFVLDAQTFSVYSKEGFDTLFSNKLHTSVESSLKIFENYALVINQRIGSFVFDISDRAQIRQVGNLNSAHALVDATIANDKLVLIDDIEGLQVVDLNSVDDVTWSTKVDHAGRYFAAKKVGDFLYVGNEGQGIQTIDINDPFAIDWTDSLSAPAFNYRLQQFDDQIITSGRWNGINIYDIGLTPDRPEHIMSIDTQDARGTAIDGDKLVIANGSFGISFIDMNDPEGIVTLQNDDYAYAVAIKDNLAYIANSHSGVSVYDITDITAPEHVNDVSLTGWAFDILLAGDNAFVAMGAFGVAILDIADVDNVQLLSTVNPAANFSVVQNIALFENELFVPARESGLFVYDVSFPEIPLLSGHYNTPNRAQNLDVDGDFIYSVNYDSGINILDNAKPVIEQDYVNEYTGSTISYDVSWDSIDDLAVNCRVTAGTCYLVDVNTTEKTAVLDWELGLSPGIHTIQISIGNSRFYRASFDLVETN